MQLLDEITLSINTFVVCNRHHILLTRRRQTKKGEISMWCQERNRPIPDGTARCPQVSNRILHSRASDIVIHCQKYRHFKLRMILFSNRICISMYRISLVGGLIFDIHCKHNLDSYLKKKQFLEAEVDGGHREERLSVFEVEEGSRDERQESKMRNRHNYRVYHKLYRKREIG